MPDLGIMRYFAGLGDPADLNDVGLYDLDGAGIDQSGEGVAPGFGLESRHGNAGPAGEFGTTRHIPRQYRLLEPAHVERLESFCIAHRHSRRQRGRGVDHEISIAADRLAGRSYALQVVVDRTSHRHVLDHAVMHGLPDVADLHLVAAKSGRSCLGYIGGEGVEPIAAAVIAGRSVSCQRSAETAKQPPEGLAGAFSENVPESDVDTRQRRHHQPAAAVIVGFLEYLFPEILRLAGILANDKGE